LYCEEFASRFSELSNSVVVVLLFLLVFMLINHLVTQSTLPPPVTSCTLKITETPLSAALLPRIAAAVDGLSEAMKLNLASSSSLSSLCNCL
jgi:hypothetical protein